MKRRNKMDCVGKDNAERSRSTSFVVMACKREERNFFLLLHVFFFFLFFFFFFFQSCYKGYSLQDCKLKDTEECTTWMLTSKPMYKENKFWSSLLLPLSKALELRTSQLVACFQCPFSLAYAVASYGCCCSYCSCSTKVEEKKKQEQLKNTRNQ